MRRMIPKCLLLLLTIVAHAWSTSPGFLKPLPSDTRFLGNDTGFVQLRGMGLGGWMIQEPYMMNTTAFANTQHDIQRFLDTVVGKPRRESFYQAWRDSFVTREDIDSLASWGFNAVRLPMHWNLYMEPGLPVRWKDEGFRLTDSLIRWCKARNLWLFLDLHAAPGGQGYGADINDRDTSLPFLWQSDTNKTMAVAFWRRLAERYKDENTIGGYDLLNETNWSFAGKEHCWEGDNSPLRQLFVRMTDTIRAVDPNHVVITEGNCWANNYIGLLDDNNGPWDSRQVVSFHKYWDSTKASTLNEFFKIRDTRRIPMWLGESGENSNEWHRQVISMCEREKIGWSWWALKRIDTRGAPFSIASPAGWNAFLDWRGSGAKPDSAAVSAGLDALIRNLRPRNCTFHPDYIDAMFRQVKDSNAARPWRSIHVPGGFGAEEYDLGRDGIAYHDSLSLNASGSSSGQAGNSGYGFRNDGVDIQWSDAENAWNIGWIAAGEWMQYTVEVDATDSYRLLARTAGYGGNFALSVDGAAVATLQAATTNGWTRWADSRTGSFPLTAGRHVLRLTGVDPKVNLGRLRLVSISDTCSQVGCTTSLRSRSSRAPTVAWTVSGLKVFADEPLKVRVFDGKGRLLVAGSYGQGSVIDRARLPGAGVLWVELGGKVNALVRP